MHYKRLAILASAIALVLILVACGGRDNSPRKPNVQPQVTWSVNQLEVVLSPGESTSRDVTFTSNVAVQNLVLEAALAISPFVALTPTTFASVPGGQPQAVRVSFVSPTTMTLGIYNGTLQARSSGQALTQTLKVVFSVFNSYTDTSVGVSVKYPPDLSVASASPNADPSIIIQSSSQFIAVGELPSTTSSDSDYVTSGYTITISSKSYSKPFDIRQWLADIMADFEVDTIEPINLLGLSAYRVTFKGGLQAGKPFIVIPHGGTIYTVAYNSTFDTDTPSETAALSEFYQVINNIRLLK